MNKDNQIQKYDKQIVINNISILMKDKGVTQAELAKGIGVSQSRISDCLRGQRDFTLSQFVDIANFFETSTDKLLGFTPATAKADETTLADVLQKLFDIDQIIGIDIWEDLEEYVDDDGVPMPSPTLYFNNNALGEILKEWVTVDSITTQDAGVKEKLLHLWKEEVLSTARSRKAKWNFRNEEEEGLHLYRYIMSMFDKRQAILERGLGNVAYNGVTKEGIKLAEKYVQKNALSLPAESYEALAFAEKHCLGLQFTK